LRKLHTCDVHAWIVESGGNVGPEIPKKAVFYRRLSSQYDNLKDIWTSRMDYIDHGNGTIVVASRQDLEGRFEGEDADEPWCGGFISKRSVTNYSWPGKVNPVNGYAMFRKNKAVADVGF
jgi:hypothetical protein